MSNTKEKFQGKKETPIFSGVPRGGLGYSTPPPEIPKALQNRAKITTIVKTVKNC